MNVQTQSVEDVEEEDLPLVVDESYSSSEDENGKQDGFVFICMFKYKLCPFHTDPYTRFWC